MGYLGMNAPFGIAHRGGSQENLENSPSAFMHALSLGFSVLETDVHATSDGVLIIMHDQSLARTSSVKHHVSELTWKQISNIRLRNNEPILRLEQLVDVAGPETRFNIDPKSEAAVEPLISFLRADEAAANRICVGSFSSERLAKIRKALPNVATSLGASEIRNFTFAARSRQAKWSGFQAAAVQVPEKAFGLRIVNQQFVDFAHSLDIQVHVWTIDNENDMNRLYDLGVDAVMTDRPTALKHVLVQRGQWRQSNE